MKGIPLIIAVAIAGAWLIGASFESGKMWAQDNVPALPRADRLVATYSELVRGGTMYRPKDQDRLIPEGARLGGI